VAFQAIIYDESGKVRAVLDPMGDFELSQDPAELARQVNLPAGHGAIRYEKIRDKATLAKLGENWHEFYDWQATVDKHLGKT
jgi:hypothetical protein